MRASSFLVVVLAAVAFAVGAVREQPARGDGFACEPVPWCLVPPFDAEAEYSTVPIPLHSDGEPWHLVAADAADLGGTRVWVAHQNDGDRCEEPTRTTLAHYDLASAALRAVYTAPDHYVMPAVEVGDRYVVVGEVVIPFYGQGEGQPVCTGDLAQVRIVVLDREAGTEEPLPGSYDRQSLSFVLDGQHLVVPIPAGDAGSRESVYALRYFNLQTGTEHAITVGQSQYLLTPIAMEWPNLAWADASFAYSDRPDIYVEDVSAPLDARLTPLVPDTRESAATFMEGNLYIFGFQEGVDRFLAPSWSRDYQRWPLSPDEGPKLLVGGDGFVAAAVEDSYRLDVFSDAHTGGAFFGSDGEPNRVTALDAIGSFLFYEVMPPHGVAWFPGITRDRQDLAPRPR